MSRPNMAELKCGLWMRLSRKHCMGYLDFYVACLASENYEVSSDACHAHHVRSNAFRSLCLRLLLRICHTYFDCSNMSKIFDSRSFPSLSASRPTIFDTNECS